MKKMDADGNTKWQHGSDSSDRDANRNGSYNRDSNRNGSYNRDANRNDSHNRNFNRNGSYNRDSNRNDSHNRDSRRSDAHSRDFDRGDNHGSEPNVNRSNKRRLEEPDVVREHIHEYLDKDPYKASEYLASLVSTQVEPLNEAPSVQDLLNNLASIDFERLGCPGCNPPSITPDLEDGYYHDERCTCTHCPEWNVSDPDMEDEYDPVYPFRANQCTCSTIPLS